MFQLEVDVIVLCQACPLKDLFVPFREMGGFQLERMMCKPCYCFFFKKYLHLLTVVSDDIFKV